ncbi:hypothetical protein TSOC_011175 [Tetrabaena socialis]|uniref:ENTH domain-containing protein n=1 Tax=Tetrabaena socialis TaxID=47790 RepID=A0A2J7ZRC0_9CHLO|nr:hypothetical protein TSOC_011175 [Tetrabaena socialis]|eukprot:PNH02790.1 hypothetical protein TSOC_011175 [Tetrabaena socialis]
MDPVTKQEAKYKTKSLMGIFNDKMEVGMAKLRGEESAALDVAIIKATLQDEVVPKEKHVRTLKIACNGSAPRQSVNYVIHGLSKRLEENHKAWLVTLKALIVFHRLMRETDPTFQEELLRYAERTGHHRMLRLESFADHTTKETWDLSAWIRTYSLYLDERLAVFRTMRFDPEQDQGLEARDSKLKTCTAPELLEQLPAVQRLLTRLVCCVPEGAAQNNEIALLACSLVRDGSGVASGPATRLVVGGPIRDPAGSPSSPQPAAPAAAAPAPPPPVDLLGFDSLSISAAPPPPAAAPPSYGGAPAGPGQAAGPFDPFSNFGAAPAPQQGGAAPPSYPYTPANSFANPAAAAAAAAAGANAPYSYPQPPPQQQQQPAAYSYPQPPPQQQQPAPYNYPPPPPQQQQAPPPPPGGNAGLFADGTFNGAPAYAAAPSPPYPPQQPPAAAAPPPAAAPQPAKTPFNPFSNPATQSAVAPHMPPAGAPPPPPGAPPPGANNFAAPPPFAVPPPPPPAAATPQPQPQPPAFANPFGSPNGGAPPPPANPFGSPGGPAPPANPFGGAPAAPQQQQQQANNPFGAGAGAGWPAAAGQAATQVVTQQVGGYNLKKPADPLMDLSLDLFGKNQAPPTQQPMRPHGGPNGSPGGLF